jgi:site-specific DNA-methyltransferase (adenine-specific)
MSHARAPRNKTISIEGTEIDRFKSRLLTLASPISVEGIIDQTVLGDINEVAGFLPASFVDLLIIDPPYNLNKIFNSNSFSHVSMDDYALWFETWFTKILPVLKSDATIYVCSDWSTSTSIHTVLNRHLKVRNRITWEREKGRGAKTNWKNSMEDIWFCTVSDKYYFDVDAVKLRRRVIAPYKINGQPKDWEVTSDGDFRLTHPSNFWSDITVPFWSMPENTDHPTQKPEKLIAKLILASSPPGSVVLDPCMGSGTTSVVAKKLGRHYVGVELDEQYACLAEKRLEQAHTDCQIQGYSHGVFWERNSGPAMRRGIVEQPSIFNVSENAE